MNIPSTFQDWPEVLRLKRGLFNSERVKMARESRGMARYALARRVGISAKELESREATWSFWTPEEQTWLQIATDYPAAFFVQDDSPVFNAPRFYSGIDENGEPWCEVSE